MSARALRVVTFSGSAVSDSATQRQNQADCLGGHMGLPRRRGLLSGRAPVCRRTPQRDCRRSMIWPTACDWFMV
jgi:hypothetical protein